MHAAWHFMLPHLTSLVGVVMGAFLVLRLLGERRATGSTMAWIFAVLLLPYVGVPFYLVFGGRKLRRKAAAKDDLYGATATPTAIVGDDEPIARMLCAQGVPPPRDGNHCQLLTTGEQAWTTLLETIDSAQRTLHVSTLILGADEIGDEVAARLTRRAQAGVEVRLLMDALFMPYSAGRRLKALQQAGGRTAAFMPVVHLSLTHHANLRLHRKIVVADDRVAIVGGMNLALEYMGPTPLPTRWHDLSARVVGPAVADIAAIFRADWAFASGEALAPPTIAPPVSDDPADGSEVRAARLQVVGSGPDVQSDLLYDAFLSAIFDARHRLWFATPYFVPDEALVRAIILAVRRGVDVRILVPAKSDHFIADLAGFSYLRDIAEVGGRICAFLPGMMHAKVIIVDDRLGIMGSANLDMRSLFLDYEIALFTSSSVGVQALAAWYESLLPSCGSLPPAGRLRALGEDVCRLLGPLV
jgi:cardiolipin synthase A/B